MPRASEHFSSSSYSAPSTTLHRSPVNKRTGDSELFHFNITTSKIYYRKRNKTHSQTLLENSSNINIKSCNMNLSRKGICIWKVCQTNLVIKTINLFLYPFIFTIRKTQPISDEKLCFQLY